MNVRPGFHRESPLPLQVLPGFEHIQRHWDPAHQMYAAKILPGEYYITLHDEMIMTVLGSCVSACVRDSVFGIGGMNHFMLPESKGQGDTWSDGDTGAAARYGSYAMEVLINNILKNGGKRERLEVKIIGGGRIISQMTDIGKNNIAFVREYLRKEGLTIVGEDVGDIFPRKVLYFPTTGKVRVKKLRSINQTLVQRETTYQESLVKQPVAGSVELF